MDYKLAKQLKDAGFPQHRERGLRQVFNLHEVDKKGEHAYSPYLEELIEVCGNRFDQLHLCKDGEWYASITEVYTKTITKKCKECGTTEYKTVSMSRTGVNDAKTPEEAVARIWLLLKAEKVTVSKFTDKNANN